MIVVMDVTLTLDYRVHGLLFNMIVVTDVTLTLYYRIHGSLFNMIVVTDVTNFDPRDNNHFEKRAMDTLVQS
jgi:hypothetical protein